MIIRFAMSVYPEALPKVLADEILSEITPTFLAIYQEPSWPVGKYPLSNSGTLQNSKFS
jgi:hypothetical protein